MNASEEPTIRTTAIPLLDERVSGIKTPSSFLDATGQNDKKSCQRKRNNRLAALKGLGLSAAFLMVTGVGVMATQAERLRTISAAYTYGYPLVMMDFTRDNFTRTMAPENTLLHARSLPSPAFRDVVRPNVDTLYSSAWLDLSAGPMIFGLPAMDRFHVMQFMDGWTDVFASVGSRTNAGMGGTYMIAGPDWTGDVPAGITLLRAPTRMVWLLGRIASHGEEDYPVVHALQDQLTLTPVERWVEGDRDNGMSYQKPATKVPPPLQRMREMDPEDFFARLQHLMLDNPPHDHDDKAVHQLATIGFDTGVPQAGTAHVPRAMDTWTRGLMGLAFFMTDRRMQAALDVNEGLHDGWKMAPAHIGRYGDDYGLRALVGMVGIGANLAADAIYPNANVDVDGQTLDGSRAYLLRFAPGELPPVSGFWSVTAYDRDGFLIDNPRNRHALGDRDALVHDPDGGLTLYLQSTEPAGDARANWLPIPAQGAFSVTARLYWPDTAVISGAWRMPGIQPVRR